MRSLLASESFMESILHFSNISARSTQRFLRACVRYRTSRRFGNRRYFRRL